MSKDNVIEFPYGRIRNPLVDHGHTQMDYACEILEAAIIRAVELGYTPTSYDGGVEDYGVMLNIIYATLSRAKGEEHFFHEMLDEVSSVLAEMKSEMKDDNH